MNVRAFHEAAESAALTQSQQIAIISLVLDWFYFFLKLGSCAKAALALHALFFHANRGT
jgi:hypothetical protein